MSKDSKKNIKKIWGGGRFGRGGLFWATPILTQGLLLTAPRNTWGRDLGTIQDTGD